MKKISIIIPCFNEAASVGRVLLKVAAVHLNFDMQKEIIVVNDASTDDTVWVVEAFMNKNLHLQIQLLHHNQNMGKGAAIRTGIAKASGDIVTIQDADLEYNPEDYNKLLQPIAEGHADAVFGSRFMGEGPHRVLFFFHTIGNKLLTFFSNLATGLNLTDMETGYKMFRAEIIKNVIIKENRFGFEPEITARISRVKGIRIYEVGISYYGRTYSEGKKITWKDGLRAVYCIVKYNFFDRS